MKKVKITTLGCKVNQYESASFQTQFEESGHLIVHAEEHADIILINTCAVTNKASKQSRQTIRKMARENPDAWIIITGCDSEIAAEKLLAFEELKNRPIQIIGNGDKHLLVESSLKKHLPIPFVLQSKIERIKEISHLPVKKFPLRTRAYLKIQDGCNSFCSYCIVPYTRGRSRSLPVDKVLKQADVFAKEGYREIVITGIHVGSYGHDLQKSENISSILQKLCNHTPEMQYRLSSIEPLEITDQLLDVMAEYVNFMPHLHIPLQSGSDEILLRMNRRYSTWQFEKILQRCHQRIDDLAVGIDILGGFPGETEEYFENTYRFLEKLDFTYLHVFPYSKRPGTKAATFDDHIERNTKNKRVEKLRKLSDTKKTTYYQRFCDKTRTLLVETKRDKKGFLKGFTDNYIPVHFQGNDDLKNKIVRVRIDKINDNFVYGTLIQVENDR